MDFPDLRALNGGQQFTSGSPVTPEVFNAIIQALNYLRGGVSSA